MVPYNKKEDYLEAVKAQIRCRKARELVAEEIDQHIEDQKAAYEVVGYDAQEALAKALEQMGDPVEAGVQLDKIHRPRLEWRILLAVLALCCMGVLAQLSLGNNVEGKMLINSVNVGHQLIFLAVGILLMSTIYFLDYTLIGKYSKVLCAIFLAAFFLFSPFSMRANGSIKFLHAYGLLFIPIFGGFIYANRSKGYLGIIKCLLLTILASLIEMKFVAQSSVYLGMLLSCIILLTIAIIKNWFGTSKKVPILLIWGWIPVIYGILTLLHIQIFRSYQLMRLQNSINLLLHRNYYVGYSPVSEAKSILTNAKLFGGVSDITVSYLPGFNTEYILTYVICYWGIAAGLLIIALFLFVIGRMLYLSYHQKNPLGMFLGSGCSLVLAVQGIIYILSNLGFSLVAQVNLPFVSYGGSCLLSNFIVLGLLLSVFRNENIVKEMPYRKIFTVNINRMK